MAAVVPPQPTRHMRPRALHQFHSGSAYGDAVTNGMLFTQDLLRELGFVSEIYVEHIAPELVGHLTHYSSWIPASDDVLLLHHSMGHDLDAWVQGLPAKKILVYHNITPSEFFPPESPFRHYGAKGREQLSKFRPAISATIADSIFNADELRSYGYEDIEVIPLLFDILALRQRPWNDELVQRETPTFTVLFVSRVAANKCQHDLVAVAAWLRHLLMQPFQLVCVGGYDANDPYFQRVIADVEAYGLSDCVRFTGKISEADLYAWYRAADVFLCLSEHEGFGVSLIEAMACDLPVVAYQSSSITATLGGAGLLVTEKNPAAVAALVKILAEDRALSRTLVLGQRTRLREFDRHRLLVRLATFLQRQEIEIPYFPTESARGEAVRLRYQIEGPLETSYSLALVNREVAFALNRKEPGHVGVFATEGPGDYPPDCATIDAIPGLRGLWQRGRKGSRADIVIRNLYPPRVADMDGLANFLYFAWEESGLNPTWVESFNRHLDGILALSEYVRKVSLDNGVFVPSIAAGCGIDHLVRIERTLYPGCLGEGFRFLHISSCFPRKGIDVLLKAYVEAFTAADDVTLVIKTFPNPHNTVLDQVRQLRAGKSDYPRIIVIEDDLPSGQIVDIYHRCHAFVAPTRGEGFGLPMAEAMLFGLPVITTAYGGQSDFCTEETAWLVDYRFAMAKTHMGLYNSVWVEPDQDDLVRQMRAVRWASKDALESRLTAARALLEQKFTWDRCADRVLALERRVKSHPPLSSRRLRLGWISSWNSKCGIAAYSSFLINELDSSRFDVRIFGSKYDTVIATDDQNVHRCWTDRSGGVGELLIELVKADLDAIIIQHNFGFISMRDLGKLIEFARSRDLPLLVTFHSTKDVNLSGLNVSLGSVAHELKDAARILVHGLNDLNRMKEWGLVQNVTLFPHGVLSRLKADVRFARETADIPVDATVIASYGFMLPHKGLEQLIEAFALIREDQPDAFLLLVTALYPNQVSDQTSMRCRKLIEDLGLNDAVRMVTDFLSHEESLALLDAADVIVFPYQDTAESSSAAVRHGLASHRPVACTPLTIFDDVSDVVHWLPGTKPQQIAQGLIGLLADPRLLDATRDSQERWLRANAWSVIGSRLAGLIEGLVKAR